MDEKLLAILILAFTSNAFAQNNIKVNFTPESEKYAQATKDYQAIWNGEGKRVIETMESVSGLKFEKQEVRVIVYEGVSFSGFGDSPMKLRASYPSDVKKATLIHELGHRLIASIRKTEEIDEHRVLFLILYDVWEKLLAKISRRSSLSKKRGKGLRLRICLEGALARAKKKEPQNLKC